MSANRTLSSLLIPLQQSPLLLPTACVVEVLDFTRPVDNHLDTEWLLGETSWRGMTIPVISFELFNMGRFAAFSATNRIAVLRRTTENCPAPFYGMVIQGLPQQLNLVPEDFTREFEETGPAEKTKLMFREVPVVLPNLALIESRLASALQESA